MAVLQQFSDPDKWKHSVSYGRRWAAETVFSSMKRMFGEYVISIKWKNVVNDLLMKAHMYNMFHENKSLNRFCTSIVKAPSSNSTQHFFIEVYKNQ